MQFADGRTRAFLNDQPVGVQVLRASAARWWKSTANTMNARSSMPPTHRLLLDTYGGLEAAAAEVARLWVARREAEQEVLRHRAEVERAQREAEWLRHAADELTELAPQPGEETELAGRRTAMMQAEKIAEDLREAQAVVSGSIRRCRPWRRRCAGWSGAMPPAPALIEPAVKALDAALTALDEAGQHLDQALAAAAFDPHVLERIEERLFALRAAGRKYNTPVDQLAELAVRYLADLARIDAGASRLAALETEAAAAVERYTKTAAALSERRREIAERLDKAVNAELKPLRLDQARFSTAITSNAENPGPHGFDRVEFWVRTNPGTQPGPLLKVASGGELARFHARPQGRDRGPWHGADPGIRRNRHRASEVPSPMPSGCGWRGSHTGCRCWRSPMRRRSRRAPRIII